MGPLARHWDAIYGPGMPYRGTYGPRMLYTAPRTPYKIPRMLYMAPGCSIGPLGCPIPSQDALHSPTMPYRAFGMLSMATRHPTWLLQCSI